MPSAGGSVMAKMGRSRAKRQGYLRAHHFTEYESRELSLLRMGDPVLRVMVGDRDRRWERFVQMARRKVGSGRWRQGDLPGKWYANLSRLYTGRGWRVKYGPVGDQPRRARGLVNVWAAYRGYEKIAPPKKDVSPWQLRRIFGKSHLERGLIFIQKAERQGGVSKSTVRGWLEEKGRAIKQTRGQRRSQLQVEYNRLKRLL